MKTKLLIILSLIVLSGCTIQKRYHRPGYHIEWKKKYKSDAADNQKSNSYSANLEEHDSKIDPTDNEKALSANAVGTEDFKNQSIAAEEQLATANEVNTFQDSRDQSSSDLKTASVKAVDSKSSTQFKALNRVFNSKKQSKSGDALFYTVTMLLALSTVGGYRLSRKKLRKLTKWSSKNTTKAQFVIAGIQLPLLGLSMYGGYNLYQLGYELSDTSMFVAASAFGLGIGTLPLLPKKGEFILQKRLNRRRAAFLGATVAGCMMLTSYGNNVAATSENSVPKQALEYVDNFLVGENETISSNNVDSDHSMHINAQETQKAESKSNLRKALNVGMCLLAILGFIALICTLCAGVCLIVFGMMGAASLGANAAMVLGGVALSVLSVLGMMKIGESAPCRSI